jgi:hypothetical protein
VSVDPRGRRIAVVADSLVAELLPELQEQGYGVIQLPPAGLPDDVATEWLEQVTEHIQEFVRTGYEVVLADDGSSEAGLAALELPRYAVEPLPSDGSRRAGPGSVSLSSTAWDGSKPGHRSTGPATGAP